MSTPLPSTIGTPPPSHGVLSHVRFAPPGQQWRPYCSRLSSNIVSKTSPNQSSASSKLRRLLMYSHQLHHAWGANGIRPIAFSRSASAAYGIAGKKDVCYGALDQRADASRWSSSLNMIRWSYLLSGLLIFIVFTIIFRNVWQLFHTNNSIIVWYKKLLWEL